MKSGEWFNVQSGVSRISVEIPVDAADNNSILVSLLCFPGAYPMSN